MWDSIDENGTIDSLVGALKNAIIDEVPHDVLVSDVTEFIKELTRKKFVTEVAANG